MSNVWEQECDPADFGADGDNIEEELKQREKEKVKETGASRFLPGPVFCGEGR
jgi:hypothetical protein